MLLSITLAALPAIVSPVPAEPAALRGEPTSGSTEAAPARQRGARRTSPRRGDDTAELIRLQARDKTHLAASYFGPRSKNDRAPAAILVHDAGRDRSQVEGLAEYLNKKGFGVLTLDLRGHGQSVADGALWLKLDDETRERSWSLAVRDVKAAADFMRERREIHSTNLSIIGVGAGCNLAVRHAIDDENVRAVVLIDPPEKVLGYDLAHGISGLEGLPCLLVSHKSGGDSAQKLQTSAHEANGGLQYIDVQVMRSPADELLEDKRLNNSSATWLRRTVMPDKSK